METETIHRPKGTSHERKALSRPVDLVHLSHYTLGERVLEREVLELFCTQSTMYLERLREAPSDQQWKDSAHSLKGSAQGIGAWHAAAAAERAETLPSAAFSEARCARLRELESSVHEAEAYIRSLF
ncbi:MAG: Hpt domain-containing protein [Methyloceanibacter sp.]|jgi:HPt (histidine-containing phosphotransfer) domain-containing protein